MQLCMLRKEVCANFSKGYMTQRSNPSKLHSQWVRLILGFTSCALGPMPYWGNLTEPWNFFCLLLIMVGQMLLKLVSAWTLLNCIADLNGTTCSHECDHIGTGIRNHYRLEQMRTHRKSELHSSNSGKAPLQREQSYAIILLLVLKGETVSLVTQDHKPRLGEENGKASRSLLQRVRQASIRP